MVHLAALLAACGEPLGRWRGPDGQVRPGVLRAVLDREAGRWPKQLAADGPVEGPVVLRRCVAAAVISSPAQEAPAAALLVAVPDLSDRGDVSRRHALARWLHRLQPGYRLLEPAAARPAGRPTARRSRRAARTGHDSDRAGA